MSELPTDPAPKKRVVRSRMAAASAPAGDASPAPKPAEPPAAARAAGAPATPAPAGSRPSQASGAAAAPTAAPSVPGRPATATGEVPKGVERKPAEPRGQDAAANAALALAVMTSRREDAAAPPPAAPAPRPASRAASLMRRPAAQAAALVVAVAAGWLGAEAVASVRSAAPAAGAHWTETAQALRQGQQDVVRLTGDIKTLKVTIESLKESVDRSKADLLAKQAQVIERIERAERAPGDGARLAKLAEQLDRVEAVGKEPVVRLAALTERFDRLERQLAAPQTAAKPAGPAADGPTQTGTLETKPPVKEAARDTPLEGWTLHEVYDGVALIEGRNRRLYEVGLGGVIPGVGAVESIERRGKRWVVVTQKGFIGG